MQINQLQDKLIENLASELPTLLTNHKDEMMNAVMSTIRDYTGEKAASKTFNLEIKVQFYGDSWDYKTALKWSDPVKFETDFKTIDLQPDLFEGDE